MWRAMSVADRVRAALEGFAVGDAMGKPAEGLSASEVERLYGRVEGFVSPVQPGWSYAEVTDDTRIMLMLAESIADHGRVDAEDFAKRLAGRRVKGWPGWEEFKEAYSKGGRAYRTGNGGPTRAVAIGLVYPPRKLYEIVDAVDAACGISHGSRSALSAGCAIAAAVSAAVEGWERAAVIEFAIEAAELGSRLGREDLLPDVARRLRWLRTELARGATLERLRYMGLNPGFQAWEGAVYALAVYALVAGAREAILTAVRSGGDADSIAAMAGSLSAASRPHTLPRDWVDTVERVNRLGLAALAERLASLRARGGPT